METWIKRSPEDYTSTTWTGGTTTQLVIAPPGASYASRDFLWRVSSATVDTAESDFTPLPDYRRLIATLRGEIVLAHNGGAPVQLRPLQVHAFSGGDCTHSVGRCTDFNLMLRREQADGTMEALTLSRQPRGFQPDPRAESLLLYCAEGACRVEAGAKKAMLWRGESLEIRQSAALSLRAEGDGAVLMVCQMWRRGEPGSES